MAAAPQPWANIIELSREWIIPTNANVSANFPPLIELSPIDCSIPKCYMSIAWVYDTKIPQNSCINERDLKDSLQKLISNEFRPLAGTFKAGKPDCICVEQPLGVLWV